jgi:hypothetical protein
MARLEFRQTMDPRSLDVYSLTETTPHRMLGPQPKRVGMIGWHKDREPNFVTTSEFFKISLTELQEIAARLKEESDKDQ